MLMLTILILSNANTEHCYCYLVKNYFWNSKINFAQLKGSVCIEEDVPDNVVKGRVDQVLTF